MHNEKNKILPNNMLIIYSSATEYGNGNLLPNVLRLHPVQMNGYTTLDAIYQHHTVPKLRQVHIIKIAQTDGINSTNE